MPEEEMRKAISSNLPRMTPKHTHFPLRLARSKSCDALEGSRLRKKNIPHQKHF